MIGTNQTAEELQAIFDLRWAADMRAIKRWQAATGRVLVWPDHADLVVWLLERLDEKEQLLRNIADAMHAGSTLSNGKTIIVASIEPSDLDALARLDSETEDLEPDEDEEPEVDLEVDDPWRLGGGSGS